MSWRQRATASGTESTWERITGTHRTDGWARSKKSHEKGESAGKRRKGGRVIVSHQMGLGRVVHWAQGLGTESYT